MDEHGLEGWLIIHYGKLESAAGSLTLAKETVDSSPPRTVTYNGTGQVCRRQVLLKYDGKGTSRDYKGHAGLAVSRVRDLTEKRASLVRQGIASSLAKPNLYTKSPEIWFRA